MHSLILVLQIVIAIIKVFFYSFPLGFPLFFFLLPMAFYSTCVEELHDAKIWTGSLA